MTAKSMLLGALLAIATVPAMAQGTSSFSLFGTVEKIGATVVAVKSDANGTVEDFKLAPNYLVVQNKPATLADIRPDDFVASAGIRAADGKLHSTELRIFPAAMRGVGEGQRPMNDARNQTMTNATVTGTVLAGGSNTMKVRFEGGESELILDPGVPVTRIEVVARDLVKAGAKVRVQGVQATDGASVTRITLQ